MKKSLNSPAHLKLLHWLKAKREERRLTMREMAEILGIPHSFIGKTEQGERRLDVVEYLQYCKALGADPVEGLAAISERWPLRKPDN
jgi:transcriptional regulator with XRE-family HTH domain